MNAWAAFHSRQNEIYVNNITKIGLAAAAIGLLAFAGNRAAQLARFSRFLSYRIIDFGLPTVMQSVIRLPITLRIQNTSTNSVNIDRVTVTASYQDASRNFIEAGRADASAFVIGPGATDKVFMAQLDLGALTQTFFKNVLTVLINQSVRVKVDVAVTVEGITLPVQSSITDIQVRV